jgi:hypothetical protein
LFDFGVEGRAGIGELSDIGAGKDHLWVVVVDIN